MVSVDTAVVTASLIYLILLELVSITRTADIQISNYSRGDEEVLDYKHGGYFPDISGISFTAYSSKLLEKGQFGYLYNIIEMSCMASLFAIASFNISSEPYIVVILITPVVAIWHFLPILVIPEYENLIKQSKRPQSLDVHLAYSYLLFVLIIMSMLIFDGFPIDNYLVRLVVSMIPIAVAWFVFTLKNDVFHSYLQTELSLLNP